MDYVRVLEILMASITGIIIALITSGYFNNRNNKKYIKKTKGQLMAEIEKNEFVYKLLKDIKDRYNSDRIYVWQFHNGNDFYTNSAMQKITITYEVADESLERRSNNSKNLLITNFSSYIKEVINNKSFFLDVNAIENGSIRILAQSNSNKSHIGLPIYDKDKNLVAIVCMDWVLNEVNQEFIDGNGFNDIFIDKIKEEFKNIDKLL